MTEAQYNHIQECLDAKLDQEYKNRLQRTYHEKRSFRDAILIAKSIVHREMLDQSFRDADKQAEIDRLTAELAAEKRRANAAVSDMAHPNICDACKHMNNYADCNTQRLLSHIMRKDCFEWRGPCEENSDAPTGAESEKAK